MMLGRASVIALAVQTVVLSAGPAVHGQTSEYYVMGGKQVHVLQDGKIVREWPYATSNDEITLAVADTVRIIGYGPGRTGPEYDLNGNDLGTRYPHPGGQVGSNFLDGTTDGAEYNFAIALQSNGVWRFDRDWKNPELLFATSGSWGGITYDPTNNSLWISGFSGNTRVENRAMDGSLISGFDATTDQLTSLGLDPADGTLWLQNRRTPGTHQQYSKDGKLLDTKVFRNWGGNPYGGEFAAGGGGKCNYTLKKVKAKGGCESCPAKGEGYRSEAGCEEKKDCQKKVKTTITCPQGNGTCKLKAKKRRCE